MRKKIAGSFELIFLFMKGIEAFGGTRRDALLSLVPRAALFLMSLAAAGYYPPKGMEEGYAAGRIAAMVGAHELLSFLIGTGVIYAIAWGLGKPEKFRLCFEASNWVALCFAVLTLPFALIAITGMLPRLEADRMLAIAAVCGYIVNACVISAAFRINWQLAGAAAIALLFVDQELSHLLYTAWNIPVPW